MPGFLLAVVLIEITPGPNMGYLTLVGTRWGRRAGLTTVAGITCGLAFYMLLAVAGVGEAILRAPLLYVALRWAGVGYLLWLAVDTWRGDRETSPGHALAAPDPGRLFTRGLVANLLNPKAAVFYIALLPGFTNPDRGNPALQALILGAIHIAISVMVHASIVMAAGSARPAIEAWTAGSGRRWLERGFALALATIALWLAWETSRTA
ncbi:MAG TPA: LysE family translocator [Phenylobacterium sp.]|jgi:threonine/homoserine/homoserine lactone efflux protein|nr:LysE family translocator [Phenylobacterium sp.]